MNEGNRNEFSIGKEQRDAMEQPTGLFQSDPRIFHRDCPKIYAFSFAV